VLAQLPEERGFAEARESLGSDRVEVQHELVRHVAPALAGENEAVEPGRHELVAERQDHAKDISVVMGLKVRAKPWQS
jgi:hypothetical protein